MIIYEYVFDNLLAPFGGLADNDELSDKVEEFERQKNAIGLIDFIEKEMEAALIFDFGEDYLYSKTIKNTYYYYLFCCDRQKTTKIFDSSLITFKNVNLFYQALENIYHKMAAVTGPTIIKCNEMIENDQTGDLLTIFKDRKAWLDYMKK
ncbi:hypothetical protein [Bartonella sp. HY038]|uniref:hypothetical protein n=1 Tax=Bartonella sp. HY038 TaxID=2759660 RepID=UPI0015F927D5|nr:hypothetical protein [Bartonella sp. HY038]